MKIELHKDEVEYLLEMLPARIESATRLLNRGPINSMQDKLHDKAKRNLPIMMGLLEEIEIQNMPIPKQDKRQLDINIKEKK